jgi:hypothetical protein
VRTALSPKVLTAASAAPAVPLKAARFMSPPAAL